MPKMSILVKKHKKWQKTWEFGKNEYFHWNQREICHFMVFTRFDLYMAYVGQKRNKWSKMVKIDQKVSFLAKIK